MNYSLPILKEHSRSSNVHIWGILYHASFQRCMMTHDFLSLCSALLSNFNMQTRVIDPKKYEVIRLENATWNILATSTSCGLHVCNSRGKHKLTEILTFAQSSPSWTLSSLVQIKGRSTRCFYFCFRRPPFLCSVAEGN